MPIQKNQGTDNTPALRFPEFEEEWVEKKLGDVSSKIGSGKTPIGGDKVYQKEGIPFIRSQNVVDDKLVLDQTFIPEEIHQEMSGSKVRSNDILLNITGASIGRSCVVPSDFDEGNVNQHVSIIRLRKFDPKFLQAILSSSKGQKLVFQAQTGSGREGLNFQSIRGFKVHFPSHPEQQKIATFLTAVDKQISLLKEKKAKLEQYKKGVMQQLFSQQIRFKPARPAGGDENGQDFPEWEPTTFGNVYSFKTTNSFSRDKLNYESGTVKNIHYGDIHTKFKSQFDITKEFVPFINSDVDLDRIADENYVQEGDLVIADASEDYADIGKAIEVVNLNGESVIAGLHTFLARRNSDQLIIGFSGHLMKSHDIRVEIMRIAQGTKVLGIATKRLADVPLLLPSKEEQQKIASFLSSIDEQIAKVGQQIAQMSSWKKGLLQKIFV